MIIPVSCFTCGNRIGVLHDKIKSKRKSGKSEKEIVQEINEEPVKGVHLKKICCRSTVMSYIDSIEMFSRYEK